MRRTDDTVLGFTDHDRDIVVDGVNCHASSGLQSTVVESELGLTIDSQEVEGVLTGDAITDADISSGRYDGARVETWMVNWAEPSACHHMNTALIGEINQMDGHFKAELRGQTALLDQVHGRSFYRDCDAILGDERCGVDTSNSAYAHSSEVIEVLDRMNFQGSGLETFDNGWFAFGKLTWLTGANSGLSMELNGKKQSENNLISLWQAMPHTVSLGDQFTIFAGCDKSFSTCRTKFENGLNFRGCPHMPGTDFALSYASGGELHDGSPLVR